MAIGTPVRLGTVSAIASPLVSRLTLSAAPTEGSMVIVTTVFAANTGAIASITDRYGNTYTQIYDSGNRSANVRIVVYVCTSQHGLQNGDTLFLDSGLSNFVASCDEITGLGTQHIPDVTIVDAASSTNVSAYSAGPTSTTTYASELIWCVVATNIDTATTQTITPGTGWTQHGSRLTNNSAQSLYTQYKIQAATAAHTGNGTLNTTASRYIAVVFTFPAPQSPESTRRASSYQSVSVATTTPTRGLAFVGVEVAGVITPIAPTTTKRRPSPIVV